MHLRARGGFTLIEVLLVVVIILMLAGALVVFVLPQQEGAERNTTMVLLRQVDQALDTYRLNVGRYPKEDEGGLGALLAVPDYENERLKEKWNGPYLKRGTTLEDPWGNVLVYEEVDRSLEENKNLAPYKLFSTGPDGQADTPDDIRLTDDDPSTGNENSKTVLPKGD